VEKLEINRAPVLTLWVSVVAERQGFSRDEAATYGKWVAGTLAQSKGRALGIYERKELTEEEREAFRRRDERLGVRRIEAFGSMRIPVVEHNGRLLAVSRGKAIQPTAARGYVERAFGDKLDATTDAMEQLAGSFPPDELRRRAYHLYEQFRPAWKGWGKKGTLDLNLIHELANTEANRSS